jgi:hypothetical protein
VLNPLTQKEELPKNAILFTSHEIPDYTVAGMRDYLERIRRSCEISGPARLLSLIKEHIPEAYADDFQLDQFFRRWFVGNHDPYDKITLFLSQKI